MRLAYQFQGQRSRSPGPLMLTHIVPHIFRMAKPTDFKLGIRMEDDDPPWPPWSKVKVARSCDQFEPSRPNAVPASLEAGGGIPCRPKRWPHFLFTVVTQMSSPPGDCASRIWWRPVCQRCQQVIIIPSRAVDLFLLPDRCFDDLRAAMRSTDSFWERKSRHLMRRQICLSLPAVSCAQTADFILLTPLSL